MMKWNKYRFLLLHAFKYFVQKTLKQVGSIFFLYKIWKKKKCMQENNLFSFAKVEDNLIVKSDFFFNKKKLTVYLLW